MDGEERRVQITDMLSSRNTPVSGSELSKILGVSRQVVVQDIALLRAENKNIISTNKGYLLYNPFAEAGAHKRVIAVKHPTERVLEEFLTIINLGGRITDVSVAHELYGQIQVDLIINNASDAEDFVRRMNKCSDGPLKILTGDAHFHTVFASSEEQLQKIEDELRAKGF